MEGKRPLKLRLTSDYIFDGRFALEGAQSYDVFKSTTERILATRGDE